MSYSWRILRANTPFSVRSQNTSRRRDRQIWLLNIARPRTNIVEIYAAANNLGQNTGAFPLRMKNITAVFYIYVPITCTALLYIIFNSKLEESTRLWISKMTNTPLKFDWNLILILNKISETSQTRTIYLSFILLFIILLFIARSLHVK